MQSTEATTKKSALDVLVISIAACLLAAVCILTGCTNDNGAEDQNTVQSAYNAALSADNTMVELAVKKNMGEGDELNEESKTELVNQIARYNAELPEKMSVLDNCKDSVDAMSEDYNDVKNAFLDVYNAANTFATDLGNNADEQTLFDDDSALAKAMDQFAEACSAAKLPITK